MDSRGCKKDPSFFRILGQRQAGARQPARARRRPARGGGWCVSSPRRKLVPHSQLFPRVSGWPSGLRRQTQAPASRTGASGLRMEAWVRIPLLTLPVLFLLNTPTLDEGASPQLETTRIFQGHMAAAPSAVRAPLFPAKGTTRWVLVLCCRELLKSSLFSRMRKRSCYEVLSKSSLYPF